MLKLLKFQPFSVLFDALFLDFSVLNGSNAVWICF